MDQAVGVLERRGRVEQQAEIDFGLIPLLRVCRRESTEPEELDRSALRMQRPIVVARRVVESIVGVRVITMQQQLHTIDELTDPPILAAQEYTGRPFHRPQYTKVAQRIEQEGVPVVAIGLADRILEIHGQAPEDHQVEEIAVARVEQGGAGEVCLCKAWFDLDGRLQLPCGGVPIMVVPLGERGVEMRCRVVRILRGGRFEVLPTCGKSDILRDERSQGQEHEDQHERPSYDTAHGSQPRNRGTAPRCGGDVATGRANRCELGTFVPVY